MSGSEFVVEPDRWSLPRRQISAVRGPLKTVPHRRTMPLWPLGLGVVGLSLALAVSLASRPAPAPAEPVPAMVAETLPTPRIVGAAEVPVPTATSSAVETPAAEPVAPRPRPEPVAPQRAAAPALDVGQLPVLQLDAAAFDAAPIAETASRPPAKPPARHAAPRIAGQP
ncbi:hypothetical protein ASG52_15710 [Methylobacterium sp. Leaf456]|uniref:hypothetical protein n=1 Tax=Methylobacterium sp. Leaf456 TaxID=1736382 RepID=UPI0006F8662A|nr:hypothetical protein [Methylobacterium sp. Leaf456]KQT45592.1 hypothetical protein ASG52_15710 [Methylobacterium sp. Leaf456]